MPDRNEKNPGNVPGPFYVDSSCIDCGMCPADAPQFFRRDDEIQMTIVHRQPETPEERQQALESMEACPTDSIGCDGEGAAAAGAG